MNRILLNIIFLAIPIMHLIPNNLIINSRENTDWTIAENEQSHTSLENILLQDKVLNGRYINFEDSLAGIEIKADTLVMFYKGLETTASSYFKIEITDTITNSGNLLNKGRYLTLTNDEMTLKYFLEYWDEEKISMIYLQRGNSLIYYKEKSKSMK